MAIENKNDEIIQILLDCFCDDKLTLTKAAIVDDKIHLVKILFENDEPVKYIQF